MIYLKFIVITIVLFFGTFQFTDLNPSKQADKMLQKKRKVTLKVNEIKYFPLSTGLKHVLFVSDYNLFTLGQSTNGQLALGKNVMQTSNPTKVPYDLNAKATFVAAGDHHSLLMTNRRDLYSFGRGNYGQLGQGTQSDQYNLKAIPSVYFKSQAHYIAAGGDHSLVITKEGEAYTFGKGSYGQLGHGDTNHKTKPTMIDPKYFDGRITSGTCGQNHTILISEHGSVYSFGKGDFGQLGLNSKENSLIPRKLNSNYFDDKIGRVSVGDNHTLLITEKGSLYTFGKGALGQLAHGDNKNQLRPKQVDPTHFNGQVVRVVAGANHSIFISEHRIAYSSGDGNSGQLGHLKKETLFTPRVIDPQLYDGQIMEISAHNDYSVLRTSKGLIYIFGDKSFINNDKQDNNQYSFMEIPDFTVN